jgi:hypothetical protein
MDIEFNGPSGPIYIVLALIVGIGAMGCGVYSYTTQSSALETAEQVNATVVSTSIETVNQRRGVQYRPHATFNYSYQGTHYTSSNVFPGSLPREFGSTEDARSVIDGYDPGDVVTAYVPADNPDGAFLKHESSDKPFLVIGFGGIITLGTIVSIFRG